MIVHAVAPASFCEIGTWTDTAFAEHGAVLSCAADRYAHAAIAPMARAGIALRSTLGGYPGHEAFFHAAARYLGISGVQARLTADPHSQQADLCAAGAVALLGGLAQLAGQAFSRPHIARLAQRLLCEEVGYSCGVQRFMTAAHGGIAWSDISPYPRIFHYPLALNPMTVTAFEERLLLISTGTATPTDLYRELEIRCEKADIGTCKLFWKLRALPRLAADALEAGDFRELGVLLREHDRLQRLLCPMSVSAAVRRIDTLAYQHGSLASCMNSTGSSMTLLCDPARRTALTGALLRAGYQLRSVHFDQQGLRIWCEEHEVFAAPLTVVGGRKAA
jgi:galactokinase/mevalonate kinase-like predicted kinase